MTRHEIPLSIDGTDVRLSCISRTGQGLPLVFLHGFGSTKEDYADIAQNPDFTGQPFFAYDAPGCGESWCSELEKISIPFLVDTALAALADQGIERFHLVGHSMGGLTSLMLAHQELGRVASFIDIEGNVAAEDCFLSRQIFLHPHKDLELFLEDFIARNWAAPFYSSPLYATSVRYKVRAAAVRGIFESMVNLSDHADLMEKFLALPFPRMFMYGEQNRALSYLPHLAANGVQLAEIARSGHLPMYPNAPEMWNRIAAFQRQTATAQKTQDEPVKRKRPLPPAIPPLLADSLHVGSQCWLQRQPPPFRTA